MLVVIPLFLSKRWFHHALIKVQNETLTIVYSQLLLLICMYLLGLDYCVPWIQKPVIEPYVVFRMHNIELFIHSIHFIHFFCDYFLTLELFLCVFLSQHLFAVQYRQLKVYIRNSCLFAVLFAFFFNIFGSFFDFFGEFKVFELNLPRHYWLNDVISFVPGVKILLKWNWHTGHAVSLSVCG